MDVFLFGQILTQIASLSTLCREQNRTVSGCTSCILFLEENVEQKAEAQEEHTSSRMGNTMFVLDVCAALVHLCAYASGK